MKSNNAIYVKELINNTVLSILYYHLNAIACGNRGISLWFIFVNIILNPDGVHPGNDARAKMTRPARRLEARGPTEAVAKLVEVALRRWDMIQEGDRILIAVSGGKDSTCLARDLAFKRKWWPRRFEIEAIHIASDFCSCCKKTSLVSLLESWNIPYTNLEVPIIGRLKPGRSMNCYWCSTQRRTELIKYAMGHGFNKIALGHHLDDMVETLMMNMMYKGRMTGMPPVLKYRKYPLSIIRPLALCEERQIIESAKAEGYRSAACTCPFGQESNRRVIRAKMAELTGGSGDMKRRMLDAIDRVENSAED